VRRKSAERGPDWHGRLIPAAVRQGVPWIGGRRFVHRPAVIEGFPQGAWLAGWVGDAGRLQRLAT
jgi:hypothetical protein